MSSPRTQSKAPARRWRPLVLALGGAFNIVLLAVACWFGVKALRKPATGPAVVAETPAAPSAIPAAPPQADSVPAVIAPPVDDEVDDLPLPREEPRAAEASAPAPEAERKPENVPPPAAVPMGPAPEKDKEKVRPRSYASESDLRRQLAAMTEFGLTVAARQSLAGSYQTDYQTNARLGMRADVDPYTLLRYFPPAVQLPIRTGSSCQLSLREAETLGVLARKLHVYLDLVAPFDATGKRRQPARLREVLRQERRGKRPEWLRAEAVPAMVQILMAEDTPVRLILVDMLSEIDAKPATIALAQRAVFDLAPEVREAAVAALQKRSRAHYRPVLVSAMRYPWPAVADHAADALVALGDRDAAPLLVAQLGKPDPAASYATANGGTAVREVVRINHLGNCLLCHAPAQNGRDPVVGIDPFANRPPSTVESPSKYKSLRSVVLGQVSGQGIWAGKVLIRADVQFLRQDFSVTFPINRQFDQLQGLRFDFVVRTRVLKGAELREWKKQELSKSGTYPQRDAALFALRGLTGKDVGPTTEAWVQLYPHANAEAEGLRLSAALLRAGPEQREVLLARYRDAKDDGYTEGLARAVPLLGGKLQEKTRAALIGRLVRLTAERLRDCLEDDDEELRRAAALACIRKSDREMIPDLITLVLDLDLEVAEGARQALQRLADEDFGPAVDADQDERVAAAAQWRAWWRRATERGDGTE